MCYVIITDVHFNVQFVNFFIHIFRLDMDRCTLLRNWSLSYCQILVLHIYKSWPCPIYVFWLIVMYHNLYISKLAIRNSCCSCTWHHWINIFGSQPHPKLDISTFQLLVRSWLYWITGDQCFILRSVLQSVIIV